VTDQNAEATSETFPCTIAVDRGDAGRRLDLVLRRHLASGSSIFSFDQQDLA